MKEPKVILSGHHDCPRCKTKDVDLYMITEPYVIRDVCAVCVTFFIGTRKADK